jgi:PAS domain S-box-containing protein
VSKPDETSRKAPPAPPVPDEVGAARDARTLVSFLDSIIDNIPAIVFVKNAETLRYERLNRAAEELAGIKSKDLDGRDDFALFPADQARAFQATDRQVLEGGVLVDVPEEPFQTPNGVRWLHTRKIPILGPGGKPRYLLGISEDITDRKTADERRQETQRQLERNVSERTTELTRLNDDLRKQIAERERAEEALRRSEEELRQSQKMEAIGRLAGGIAHDFNNLLSIILSYSAMMMEALSPDDPLRADAEQIAIAGQRARDLTRQLLAFSRRQMLRPEVIDVGEVVRGVEPMLRRVLGEDIELTISLAQPSSLVKADPGQLQQILMNLVVNARDAMPDGGQLWIETADVVLDEAHVRGQVGARPGPHVCLSVSDTGVGLDEETRARIFEPFFTTKPRGKGTGLGLSTVYGIVQQSGGTITCASVVGQGTTFVVTLPRVAAAVARADLRVSGRAEGGSETVLLVEDEERVRQIATEVLERVGYRVLPEGSAAAALARARAHHGRIELLLTDVVLPDMNGRELAERLRAARPDSRVLYTSGYTDEIKILTGQTGPGTLFLPKPYDPPTLLRSVREVLAARAS